MRSVLQFGEFICFSAMIPSRLDDHRNHGNATHGDLRLTCTVIGSTTLTDWMLKNTNVKSGFCSRYLSRLSLTTCAVRSVPSWNLMPERSLIVHCVYAALGVTDSARNGWILPSWP